MNWIQNISSTLKTWVFKNKLLKFSSRYNRDPLACFYCPEMCRFSCPVAETLRNDAVTPRAKMSMLHVRERALIEKKSIDSIEDRIGPESDQLWILDQCTGCGRCTEYCIYEIDVASQLRNERGKFFAEAHWQNKKDFNGTSNLSGNVLLVDKGRCDWWKKNEQFLRLMNVDGVEELMIPNIEWAHGELSTVQLEKFASLYRNVRELWVESPEVAWFFLQGLQKETNLFRGKVRSIWQVLYSHATKLQLGPHDVFHESWHLGRLLPRHDFSVPMLQKGMMPFHSGWNVLDCGGEGHYKHFHAKSADMMAHRFLDDLCKDGRQVKRILCQSQSCVAHLQKAIDNHGLEAKVVYWLDAEEL